MKNASRVKIEQFLGQFVLKSLEYFDFEAAGSGSLKKKRCLTAGELLEMQEFL